MPEPGARIRDGIPVRHRDDALLVKRVALGRSAGKVDGSSDNTACHSWPHGEADEIQLLGRLIWSARRQV